MSQKVTIINLNLNEDHKCLQNLSEHFSDDEFISIETMRNVKDIVKHIRLHKNTLLVFKLEAKSELIQFISFMKANIDLVNNGFLKSICILSVKSEKVERILYKYGCTEVVLASVSNKALILKAELAIKTIRRNQNNSTHLIMGHKKLEGQKNVNESENNDILTFDQLTKDEDDHYILDSLTENDFQNNKNKILKIQNQKESEPQLLNYFKENGEMAQLNLESGSLNLNLGKENEESFCQFEEFEESRMVLSVDPEFEAEIGQEINLMVKFVYNKCRIEIELTGTVNEIEEIDHHKKHLNINFAQNESEKYTYFMELFQKRQKSINDFIALARGVDPS
jgi:hypothetical protein